MRLLATIAILKAGLALSPPEDQPVNPMGHMTMDSRWKSAENEPQAFYTRSSLAESEVDSLNHDMNNIFEEYHSTLADWPSEVTQAGTVDNLPQFSGTVTAPKTITITNGAMEMVVQEGPEPTADATIMQSVNPETGSSSVQSAEPDSTPTSESGSSVAPTVPSPASTGSSNQAPTQSFGVVLLALGAFFL